MFTVEKSKRKNDAPHARRPLAIGLAITLVIIFIAGLILQSLLVSPDPTGHLYYSYAIDPTADVFMRHSFDGVSSAHSVNRPIPTLSPQAPAQPWQVGWRDVEGEWEEELVVRDTATKEVIRVLGRFYSGYYTTLNLSPDSQWVVFEADIYFVPAPGRSSGDYPRDLWMVHVETGEARRLTNTSYDEVSPSFTPDGLSVLYRIWVPGASRLYLYDIAAGTSRLLTPDLNVQDYRWSPDKQRLIFKTDDPNDAPAQVHQPAAGALYALTLPAGLITPLVAEPIVYDIAWSPDSQWIAFTRYDPIETLAERNLPGERQRTYYLQRPSSVWLMRPDGSERHSISSASYPLEYLRWVP